MTDWVRDLAAASRGWRRRPWTTTTMVATLGVGLSATALVAAIVSAVLIEPLPYREPQRLVAVHVALPSQQQPFALFAGPEVHAVANRAGTVESLGGLWARPAVLTPPGGRAVEIEIGWMTPRFLEVFGVTPLLGRLPSPEEELARSQVVVLAYDVWRDRYAASHDIVGSRIDLDGEPVTVVGVMPEGFRVLLPAPYGVPARLDAWVPWGPDLEALPRSFRVFSVVARLAPGHTTASASASLATLAAELEREHVGYASSGFQIGVARLDEALAAPVRPTLTALGIVVLLVVVIAVSNVANLLLAQAPDRGREMAMRQALGAARVVLLRAALVESTLLGLAGAATGALAASAGLGLLRRLGPETLPRLREAAIDVPTSLFVAGVVLAVSLAIGLISFGAASAMARRTSLRDASPRGGSARASAFRHGLVVAQIALALVLVAAAGLLVRTFVSLRGVPLGFDPRGVVTARLSLPDARYRYDRGGPRIGRFYQDLEDELRRLPGVVAAGATLNPPLSALPMRPRTYSFRTEQGEAPWGGHAADYRTVTPGWFEAVSAELRAGRVFDSRDGWDRPIAVVVDERLAAKAWPGRDAVGQAIRVELFRDARFTPTWAEVIGVIGSIRLDGLAGEQREQLYLAHQQAPQRTMYPAVRVAAGAVVGSAELQQAVDAIEPGIPLFEVRPAAAHVAEALAPTSFALAVLAVFAGAAGLLSGAGVYAAVACVASERRREIGIRLAVGGTPAHVRRLVMRQGLGWILAGVALGLVLAIATSGAIDALLHGVRPNDPATLGTAAFGLILVGVTASWIPAWRASRSAMRL